MADDPEADYRRFVSIMFPWAVEAEARVANNCVRFVHYTSAQAALEILKSRCIWMRNATCMNDYNEMRHGLHCVVEAFKTEAGRAFNNALDAVHGGLAGELDAKFTGAVPKLLDHTYLTCVSEHSDEEELYGRLSMWRSYGSGPGVALVLNNGPFQRSSNALPIWSSPVAYMNAAGVQGQIEIVANKLESDRGFLAKYPRDVVLDTAFRALIFAVVSSKHAGFREEREWRVVHFPLLWPAPPERLPLDQVALGGVPQPIFKIPFVDYPQEGFYGVTIPDLVHRVIVGPTQYPAAIQMAMVQLLATAGVQNAVERVHCSDVTLRV